MTFLKTSMTLAILSLTAATSFAASQTSKYVIMLEKRQKSR